MEETKPEGHKIDAELKMLREMVMRNHDLLKSMRRQMRLAAALGALRLLLILVPLVLALVFLPPFLREAVDYYRNFTTASSGLNGVGNLNLTELQNLLQSTGLLER